MIKLQEIDLPSDGLRLPDVRPGGVEEGDLLRRLQEGRHHRAALLGGTFL